jgi:tetratricopeptide (TPR) repeat protein
MIEIPASLIERIKARQAVLVTGVGCAPLAGLPGWDDLAERVLEWIDGDADRAEVQALLASGRLAAAVSDLRSKMPDRAMAEAIKDAYPSGRPIPEIVARIARIPWRAVVTTAFDDLWDRALLADAANPTSVFVPRDAEAIEGHRGRFLLHLFGSAAAPDALCLSPEDLRARVTPTGVIEQLDELYRQRSFVFVGFRPGDPDFRLVTERLLGANVRHAEHFMLYAGEAGVEARLVSLEQGLTPVPFSGALDDALGVLADSWIDVVPDARPGEDDAEGWLEVWTRDPTDDEARAVLRRIEDRLRAEKDWERLVGLLLGRVEGLADAREQVAVLREVARVFEGELDAPDRAFAALSTALHLDHAADGLIADLLRVTGQAGLWADLVGEYTGILPLIADPAARARHWLEIARIHAEELNQLDHAEAMYQESLGADPNGPALRPLADLLTRQEKWPELAAALTAAADRQDDAARRLALRQQLADIQAARLGDADAAIASYEQVRAAAQELAEPAALGEALEALDRLYRQKERWPDLLRVLEAKLARVSDPADGARLRAQRAELLERTGDVDASIAALEAAVEADRANRAALRSLEKLYDRQGRDQDYLRTLERLAEVAETDAERLMLLRRLAAEWDERPDGVERAAEALEQILQIDAQDDDAFRALGRVYRQNQRWLPLADALTRKIEVTGDPAAMREHYAALGRICDEELQDPVRAMEAYGSAVGLGDEREATLAALARLYEQQGRWRSAAEVLDTWAKVAREPATSEAALVRAGALYAGRLDDRAAARERYARALELDPGDVAALSALGALQRDEGDHGRAAELLVEAAQRTQDRADRARLLHEAAALHEEPIGDRAKAAALYAEVLAIDPDHVASAERLAHLHLAEARFGDAEAVLETLARMAAQEFSDLDAADIQRRLGFVARRQPDRPGAAEKALRAYEAAHTLTPTALPVLAELGDLRMERGEWSEALPLYRAILAHHEAALPQPDLVDVYVRLARCDAGVGDREGALRWYERAAALDRAHRGALEGITALHVEKGDFAALVLDKRALAAIAGSDDEKARLSEEMGDIYVDRLRNPAQAIAAYQAVLALQPDRRDILQKLLALYTAGKHWPQAVETLASLADLEDAADVRATYAHRAGLIRRDELGDIDGAVALLNVALDDAPAELAPWTAIEELLTGAGNWRELARNYRRMLRRLPEEGDGHAELKLRLWTSLGEVALQHLGDRDLAITAFEAARALDPDNIRRLELLGEIYLQGGEAEVDKAIAAHQLLVARNPDRLASYRALAKLYRDAGELDKSWCVAATLCFLRRADPDLQQLYDRLRPRELRAAQRAFNAEVWQNVAHPDEDRFVAALFGLVGEFVAAAAAQQHQAVGLRRKDRVDLAQDERPPARILRYVASVLELPAPDLFFRDGDPERLSLLNLAEKGALTPAMVVGGGVAAARPSDPELAFELGKQVALLRPERLLRFALPSAEALDVALRSALLLVGAGIGPGAHNGEVDELADELRRTVPRGVIEQMTVVGQELLASRGEVIDMQAYLAATDLSAARAGLVLAGELPAAARVISSEPASTSPLAAKQRMKDLIAYSVSEDYFAARKILGLDVNAT